MRAKNEAIQHEKAIFDFDEDINDLEDVAERYKISTPPKFSEANLNSASDKKPEAAEPKPQDQPFFVKRTERPVFDSGIMADLAALRNKANPV